MATLSVRNLTRRSVPAFAFTEAAKASLPKWELSLVFVTSARAQELNTTLRKKTYVPNVLSFETGEKSGEIIICLEEAKKQASSFDMPYDVFVGFLFIHGILHLEGYRHGPTMDTVERTRTMRFAPHYLNETKNSHRNRHRHRAGEDRRR